MIMSKYTRNKLVDAAFRGIAASFPATYYVALLTSAPTVNDAYTEIGSVAPNGYARMAITSNTTNWAATNGVGTTTNPSSGTTAETSNNAAIVFPNPSGGDWYNANGGVAQPITHVALFDSATIGAGNMWFYMKLGAAKTVKSTDTAPTIPAAALKFILDR